MLIRVLLMRKALLISARLLILRLLHWLLIVRHRLLVWLLRWVGLSLLRSSWRATAFLELDWVPDLHARRLHDAHIQNDDYLALLYEVA